MDRVKILEDRQKPSVTDLRKGVAQYALRQNSDFDKCGALELIEGLKNAAILCKDKKADFHTTVHIKLLERMDKPAEHFKGYVLALIGDREYEKIMESVAKIDKSLYQATPVSSDAPQLQDHNFGYSFPSPCGYPPLPPYQGVIPQPPIIIIPPTIISLHLTTLPHILVLVTAGVILPALLPFLGETGAAEAVTGVYVVISVEDHIE